MTSVAQPKLFRMPKPKREETCLRRIACSCRGCLEYQAKWKRPRFTNAVAQGEK